MNNAARIPDEVLAGIDRVIAIEWELDSRFVPALRSRIETVIANRAHQTDPKRGAA